MDNKLSIDEKFLKKLVDLLETNLEKEHFGVGELASAMGLSRSQLHRKLNTIEGKSTSQYIREFRLKRAMEMLQNNVATASEIAYKVGFSSPTYFNTSFHQYYGYPPGEVKFRNPLIEEEREKIVISTNQPISATSKNLLFSPRTFLLAPLAILLILGFGWYSFKNSDPAITTENNIPANISENSIAVLPFKNMSGNPENEAFCDGMTAAIISRLSKIKGINKVTSLTSMMNYKNNNEKSLTEIADELKVRYVLETGFQKVGNNIKMNLQLIDGKSEQLFWSQEYNGTYDSIFKIQAQVAEMVAKKLDANITKEEQMEIEQTMTQNLEAYDYFLKGAYVFSGYNTKAFIASRKYFEKAIALDSGFTEAYVQLGGTYEVMGSWFGNMNKSKADSLAAPYYKKALELNPSNLNLLYGRARTEFFKWNFKAADSIFIEHQKMVGENSYPDFLNLILGRYDRVTESENFRLNNLTSSVRDWPVVYAYFHIGEIDSTLYIMKEGLHQSPNNETIYDHFGNIYLALEDYEMAKNVLETGLQISNKRYASMLVHLALANHYLDNEQESLKDLNEVITRAKNGEPEINVFIAHYYARLGKNDEAFKWLDIAYKKHEVDLIWLKADPNLLLLKNDPRYKVLCDKIGFPKI